MSGRPKMDSQRLFVVGAGAAGTALALGLLRHGPAGRWTAAEVACRTEVRAQQRCALLGAGTPLTLDAMADPDRDAGAGPAVLIVSVPDRFIGAMAQRLAKRRWPNPCVALHVSGAEEVDVLAPLSRAGLPIGALHPLASFVDPDPDADALAGTVMALQGEPAALAVAREIVADLSGRPLELPPGGRSAWHAGATHACNHLVALVDQALDLLERAGLPREAGRAALLPMLAGTLRNLQSHAPGQALTGPVVRGDLQVVERHLDALSDQLPDVRAAYTALAARALRLAIRDRDLDPQAAAALRELLERKDPA